MATPTEILAALSAMVADWQKYLDNLANWSGGTGTKPLQDAAGNQRQVKTPHELDRLVTAHIANVDAKLPIIEAAEGNANAALASKNAAKVHELKSKDWATKASVVESGLHSSKTYASQSATSASQSLASKNAAKTSETNALNSKNAAATSASQALTYKNNSASSATLSQNWASKSGSAVSGSLWSSKHYSEQAKVQADIAKAEADRLAATGQQFMLYDPNRTYRTGEVCAVLQQGRYVFYQMYAGKATEQWTCKGKNPSEAVNRADGWTHANDPWWWTPYMGEQTGAHFYWVANSPPLFGLDERSTSLKTTKYWRVAVVLPHLVDNGVLRTCRQGTSNHSIEGRFIRSHWNSATSTNQVQNDAMRQLHGSMTMSHSGWSQWQCDHGNGVFRTGGGGHGTNTYDSKAGGSRGKITFYASNYLPNNVDTEIRPRSIFRLSCLYV